MDVKAWKRRNNLHKLRDRAKHPWPMWKRVGGLNAVVVHADGTKDDLGRIADHYIRRRSWVVIDS